MPALTGMAFLLENHSPLLRFWLFPLAVYFLFCQCDSSLAHFQPVTISIQADSAIFLLNDGADVCCSLCPSYQQF
jgi:hypothetical protein